MSLADIAEILETHGNLVGAAALVAAIGLVEVTPIKLNPWTRIKKIIGSILKWVGKSVNAEVLREISDVKAGLQETQSRLEEHIQNSGKKEADDWRAEILHFNNELLHDVKHTKEEFIDILSKIDSYEIFCREHEEVYENSRAVHAIASIHRVYDECLEQHSFL